MSSTSATPTILSPGPSKVKHWYRGTLFNAYVIGAVGFAAPGLWNAMNALGAGGARSPYLVNLANALVFGLMALFCVGGPTVTNYIGLKWTLVLGAVGYPIYAAGLYCNLRFQNVWFVILGAVLDGISAGLFWSSEGTVAIGYPEPAKRGQYLNIWVWFRTLGPLIGGAIVLGLNHSEVHRGAVGSSTYIVFIVLQCLAVPIALLLTPPEKVERSDGSKVEVAPRTTLKKSLADLWRSFLRKEILLLLPIFSGAYFYTPYSGTFNTLYFGVRARALLGFISNFPTLLGSQLISTILDSKRVSRRKRLLIGFWIVLFTQAVAWIYAVIVIAKFRRDSPTLDWTDPLFTEGFFVGALWSFAQQIVQSYLYYVVGTLTDEISELNRYTGILRGVESLSQAVSYGLNASDSVDSWIPLGINIGILVIAIIPTGYVVFHLNPTEDEEYAARYLERDDAATKVADDAEVGSEELSKSTSKESVREPPPEALGQGGVEEPLEKEGK